MPDPATDRVPRRSRSVELQDEDNDLARLLLNATGEGIYGIDLTGHCTFANQACLSLLGYDREEQLLGQNMHDLVHHHRPDGTAYPEPECRIYQALRQNEGTHVDDEVLFRADGTPFPVEYWSFPVFRSEERIGCVVTFLDITERKRAAEQLDEQARQLAELARFPDMNPGPVVRLDSYGTVRLANPAARAAFGTDNLRGNSWLEICPGMTPTLWDRVLRTDSPLEHETQLRDRDFLLVHTPEATHGEVFVFGIDLTQQRQAERALRQSERMATLGTLAAGVAHELNNPAAAAQRAAQQLADVFAELQKRQLALEGIALSDAERSAQSSLVESARERAACACQLGPMERSDMESSVEDWLDRQGVDDAWEVAATLVEFGHTPETLERLSHDFEPPHFSAILAWLSQLYPVYNLLEEIRHGAGRLSEIVGALKSYSFVGQAPVQAVDLNEGIRHTLIILRNKLKVGVEVVQELDPALPRIQAYGGDLNQVWTNLIDNAIGAMAGRGRITVRTRCEEPWAVVEIEDDGPGIPPGIQSRIFDAFFTTKQPGEGTGLGLHTTYTIVVNKHGGTIDVDSEPGCTRFTVKLPLSGIPNTAAQEER